MPAKSKKFVKKTKKSIKKPDTPDVKNNLKKAAMAAGGFAYGLGLDHLISKINSEFFN